MAGCRRGRKAGLAALGLLLALCEPVVPGSLTGRAAAMSPDHASLPTMTEISFAAISGWQEDDQGKAIAAFLRFCAPPFPFLKAEPFGLTEKEAADLCYEASKVPVSDQQAARSFFETWFTPFRIDKSGFVTGYFEPELPASRVRTPKYPVPLLTAPTGLEAITDDNRPEDWPEGLSHGRRTDKGLVPLPDRGAIMDGALDDEHLELVWLANPIDAYFVHVQGSARLRLTDGSVMRVGYAGKAGYPYTSIARVLVERGEGTPEELTMSGLRNWLEAHPDQRDTLFKENRSFIFFREVTLENPEDGPIGAAELPLVAGRSLAVDPRHIPYGMPVFVSAGLSDPERPEAQFGRLMIADDTGSAIKGPARGDIFTGSGDQAGKIAGEIRHQARMILLLPGSKAR
ncbi:MltA domain-containing protein [uncultured Roseibium sp.]|uniref:murein transglycosylase A n=1 Tax=uncultured Roseibium sp. TaxID=1936171 RepID=UPI003216CDF5